MKLNTLATSETSKGRRTLQHKKHKTVFEDRVETLDTFKAEQSQTIHTRDYISKDYQLIRIDDRRHQQKEHLLLKFNYEDQKIVVFQNFTDTFNSTKCLLFKGGYLVIFSQETTLEIVDIMKQFTRCGESMDIQGHTNVKMMKINERYFMIITFKYQLFKITFINGVPNVKLVSEIIAFDYQVTTNKIYPVMTTRISQRQKLIIEHTHKKLKILAQVQINFKNKKIKAIQSILKGFRIYDMVWITKTKFIAITTGSGVRIVVCDIKKRSMYEIKWFKNTTKVRMLPGFHHKSFPFILLIQYDSLKLRNWQNLTISNKFRDTKNDTYNNIEVLKATDDGVMFHKLETNELKLQRINYDYYL